MQTAYQADLILRGWEDSRLTPPECEYPPEEDLLMNEVYLKADDENEERFIQRMEEGKL